MFRPAVAALIVSLGLSVAVSTAAQDKPGMAPAPAPKAPPTQSGSVAPEPGSEEWLRQRGESYHSAPESAQDPAEVEATGRLNAEIVASNAAAASLESEEQAEYDRAQANYQEDLADAEAAQRQWEADKAAADAAHAEWVRAREVWENMVRACERSGRRDCRPPRP